ncbi:AAR032Wp [Eremothecium gossypii ATCC 10895]|uniref:AAR032Wp n=1 Tax=Eremothecium gossypii (strain ATCC 10895 / CBS 109.51 / FGSC 9923 / NRRL Y-1056) TaxID=284811 RepID=Q75EP7_EREGS|nr:AAR032Wp [Eremothecium gossypii ATCC 10895]AAS50397.2 AAR032Wp [Eremothecium gossypii ATCC 10895]AEY94683.1 FAAR032Wp [Eremothecium gossypii FDAG1]
MSRILLATRPCKGVTPYALRPVLASRYNLISGRRLMATGPAPKSDSKLPAKPASPAEAAPKPSLWSRVKHEAQHYWDGTKLLGLEVKISFKLVMKMSAGYELSRREMLQLKRTTTDVVRLVPFSAFVIIPFAELLLPIALKLFPNMLPSTYESKTDKQKKLENLRKTRAVMSEIIKEKKSHFKPSDITESQKMIFNSFYKHVRETGEPESREQLIQVARLFSDDTVLDNLTRPHLVAIAKYINLQPFGTDVMLRYRIRYKMLQLKKDDFALFYEGVDLLNSAELRTACASRGIRNLNVEDAVLRDNLNIWLNMRLKEKIPSTLLIMATAYTYGDISSQKTLYDALCDVLSGIPDELYHEVKVNVVEEDDATNKSKMAQLREQEEIMREEEQQEKDAVVKVRDQLRLDDLDEPAAAIPEPVADKEPTTGDATKDGKPPQHTAK